MSEFSTLYMLACLLANLGTGYDGLIMRDEVATSLSFAQAEIQERGYHTTLETERMTNNNLEFFKRELLRTNTRSYIVSVADSLVIYLEDLMKSREEYLEGLRQSKFHPLTI